MSLDTVKERIRKLMAYATQGSGACEGEIENALGHAQRLIDQHNLRAEDFDPSKAQPKEDLTFTQGSTTGTGPTWSKWESNLAKAICELYGTLSYYIKGETQVVRLNGVVQIDEHTGQIRDGRVIVFYGPSREVGEACELFKEWALSICSMAQLRWGGSHREPGVSYCVGFSQGLLDKTKELNAGRRALMAKPITLSESTEITLWDRNTLLKDYGEFWLKHNQKVRLNGSVRVTARGDHTSSAFGEGYSHGQTTTFGRQTARKGLPL